MSRIASVTTHMISVPRPQPVWTAHEESKAWSVILTELRTDDGLVGYGEIHGTPMPRICEWVSRFGEIIHRVAIERFVAPYFIGQDPTYIERLVPVIRDAEILGAPVVTLDLASDKPLANLAHRLHARLIVVSRAAAVKEYLVSKGFPSSKITTIGKGESQPVATNKTSEGRQKNRRVDIEFKGVRK